MRVYDEATKTQVVAMSGGHGTITAGHSNRVFSIKWMPNDENVLLSGGWDNTIQIWDVRVQHSVRSIYGPHIAGDALDIQGEEILTGSWRADNPLEVLSFFGVVYAENGGIVVGLWYWKAYFSYSMEAIHIEK